MILVLAIIGAAPAAAVERHTKTAFRVPVTQPDEVGGPVSLDVDVYLPKRRAPRHGYPLVGFFHGGGSDKTNGFDAAHAAAVANRGFAAILYSARGHGDSDGQITVAGPKEVRDGFDVLAWALGIGGRDQPAHPDFDLDRRRIALAGYSQGGLHTNLLQAHVRDRSLNPYRIRFRALLPANTPDLVYEALIQNAVLKLSFGIGLLQTYFVGGQGQVAPIVDKWIATAAADLPGLAGGRVCDHAEHDTETSTMKSDLAVRSVGCFTRRMRLPSHWAQSFDDQLFTADMGIRMWKRMPAGRRTNRLYLSMGGHGAPSADPSVERRKFRAQVRFLRRHLRGRRARPHRRSPGARVVYWTRDPAVAVPADAYRYPKAAWHRHRARNWPPARIRPRRFQLDAGGTLVRKGASAGTLPLAPFHFDEASDPVASAAASATPLGTSIVTGLPATDSPGFVAAFETRPFRRAREMSGAPRAKLGFTPLSPDAQVVLKVFDRAPDGTLSLLGRGVKGMRGVTPLQDRHVGVSANHFSALIRRGHSILAWVTAADAFFYKPYPLSLGGVLEAGPSSTLKLPLGPRPRSGR